MESTRSPRCSLNKGCHLNPGPDKSHCFHGLGAVQIFLDETYNPIYLMVSIASLSPHIKGDIVTPDHPDYRNSLRRWAINAERNAAVIVFPKDEDDVSKAIDFAQENKLAIAIRGGGHSPAGASSVEGGLVIDLSRHLSGVQVDPAKRLAYVGGGAIWETVDKAAIEHGLATVGGTVNHVCMVIKLASIMTLNCLNRQALVGSFLEVDLDG